MAILHILIDKPTKYGLDKWTVRWTENCQNGWALWSPAQSPHGGLSLGICPRAWHWDQYYLTPSSVTWMTGDGMFSICVQTTQNCEEWLIHLLDVLSFRGTSSDWKIGQRGTSLGSATGNAKSYPWEGKTPCTSMCWGPPRKKAVMQRRTWGPWWASNWPWASNAALLQRRSTACWAALGRVLSAVWGRWPFTLTQHLWGTSGVLCPVLIFPT